MTEQGDTLRAPDVPKVSVQCVHITDDSLPAFATMRMVSVAGLAPDIHRVNYEALLCPYCAGLVMGTVKADRV
jgi:hypothetical protein